MPAEDLMNGLQWTVVVGPCCKPCASPGMSPVPALSTGCRRAGAGGGGANVGAACKTRFRSRGYETWCGWVTSTRADRCHIWDLVPARSSCPMASAGASQGPSARTWGQGCSPARAAICWVSRRRRGPAGRGGWAGRPGRRPRWPMRQHDANPARQRVFAQSRFLHLYDFTPTKALNVIEGKCTDVLGLRGTMGARRRPSSAE